MREGIYRLYRLYVDDHAKVQRRQVARFVLYGEELNSLEDYDGLIEALAPNGYVDGEVLARLKNMDRSPYWELVHEDDIQAGQHEHLLPEMRDGGPGAWPQQEQLAKADVLAFPSARVSAPVDLGAPATVQTVASPSGYSRAKRTEDYTNLLPPDIQAQGYQAFLDHGGYDPSHSNDGYAQVRLMLNGQQVGSQLHYPGIDPKPGEGRPFAAYPGHPHEKAVIHLPVILGEHAKKWRQAWHRYNDPKIQQKQEEHRAGLYEALDDRTRGGERSLAQSFRARNEKMGE